MSIKDLNAYDLIEERELPDVSSRGYYLRHRKSGARVIVLSNEDDNKVFSIGFRTPPVDNCGVPHIIEHTTLCGSEKYPLKDPFVELIKGSLNTFLNAMTYPDKTVYPVASCNDQDYKNLMDVYMDAVFHPNLTKFEEIFRQEGWHYELDGPDGELRLNGVVYNEMKGAYSDPGEVLSTAEMEALFPDTAYSRNSGGDPDAIPDLTYEHYLELYRRFYHPSNSYIYLYGDMDAAERLDYLDREYLDKYERQEVDTAIRKQEPFGKMTRYETKYSISTGDTGENRTQLSYSMVIGDTLDQELVMAFDVIKHALISSSGAPVRQALIDAGIGEDVYGTFEDELFQPVFSIVARNANREDEERFISIIRETLRAQVEAGISQDAILASINSSEFSFREGDYGQFPKGLFYGLDLIGRWLHTEEGPFLPLQCLSVYEKLRRKNGTGYYEQLVQKYLLDNTHGSVVVVVPEKGLAGKKEEELKKKLAAFKDTLDSEEIKKLIEDTKALQAYQEAPESEADLRRIPMLTRADMKRESLPFSNIEDTVDGVKVIRHDVATNGIDYLSFLFDVNDIPVEELSLLGMLRHIIGYVDTAGYTYAGLDNAIDIHTGGISLAIGRYVKTENPDELNIYLELRIKVLEEELGKAEELAEEMLFSSKLSDVKRLKELLVQERARLQNSLSSSGNSVAAMRALAGISPYAFHLDATNGIRMYQGLCGIIEELEKEPGKVTAALQRMAGRIFSRDRLLVSITAQEEAYGKAKPVIAKLISALPAESEKGKRPEYPRESVREGFTDASQIQYVARVGRFTDHGYADNGYLRILRTILGFDYLWMNVRVKGGAYGCGSSFMRTGECYFTSYRDPNLSATNEIFEGIPEYLEHFDVDEHEMTKYIIGTFSALDTPLYPEAKGTRSMTAYLQELPIEALNRNRMQIIEATPADIRAQAGLVRSVLAEGRFCVIGNENKIREESRLFDRIADLR